MRELKFRAWLKGHWAEEEYDTMLYDYQNTMLEESQGLNTDEYPIMQYINRVDKDGREIYEGDIVEFEHSTHIYQHLVTWGNFNMTSYDYCKVIGNIYENPELVPKSA